MYMIFPCSRVREAAILETPVEMPRRTTSQKEGERLLISMKCDVPVQGLLRPEPRTWIADKLEV